MYEGRCYMETAINIKTVTQTVLSVVQLDCGRYWLDVTNLVYGGTEVGCGRRRMITVQDFGLPSGCMRDLCREITPGYPMDKNSFRSLIKRSDLELVWLMCLLNLTMTVT